MASAVTWLVHHLPSGAIREVSADTAFSACMKLGWLMSECAVNRA